MAKFLFLPDANPGPVFTNLPDEAKNFSEPFLKPLKKYPHVQATGLPHYYECIAVVRFIL